MANVKLCKYERCTIVQAYCIPIILAGHDTVAVAQTGSGKTAAYLVPIISNLMGKAKKLQGPRPDLRSPTYNPRIDRVRAEPLVVIVCPTRELAQQIFDEARRLCYRSMLRPACAYGGVPLSTGLGRRSMARAPSGPIGNARQRCSVSCPEHIRITRNRGCGPP